MDYSTIRDNHSCGTVGDFSKQAVSSNSEVSIHKIIHGDSRQMNLLADKSVHLIIS
ncbi:MAG: hypothetical protein QME49_05895 [bacterium]|nr:hypothetical protein [bacterium]